MQRLPISRVLLCGILVLLVVGSGLYQKSQRTRQEAGAIAQATATPADAPVSAMAEEKAQATIESSAEPTIKPTPSTVLVPQLTTVQATDTAVPAVNSTSIPTSTPTLPPTATPTPYPFLPIEYTSGEYIGIHFFYPADLVKNARDNGVSLGAQSAKGQLLASCGCQTYNMSVDKRSTNPNQPWASGGVTGFYDAPKHGVMVDGEEALVTDVMNVEGSATRTWMASIHHSDSYYFFYAVLPDYVYTDGELHTHVDNYPDQGSISRLGEIFEYFVSSVTWL